VYDTSKFVGAREKVLNIDRAVSTLGWRPKATLEEGLTRTIAWHREHILPSRLTPVGAAR
jgi:nucleoside-diphosphate-sugar epimerase